MGFAFGSALVRSFGALWHGKYESVHKRFSRWAKKGVWEKVFHEMVRDRKNQYLMIDSIIVRAHQQAATGRKKGGSDKALGALPRRSDDEDSSAGRRTGPAGGLRRHSGTGERLHAGDPAAGSAENRPCAGRQHRYNRRAHCHHGRGRCDPPKCNGSCSANTARLYKQRNRIERCFAKLNTSAASPPDTRKTRKTSKLSSLSLAPGYTFRYISIRPRRLNWG